MLGLHNLKQEVLCYFLKMKFARAAVLFNFIAIAYADG